MKKVLLIIIIITSLFVLFAQVDRSELESTDYGGVEFLSYKGPHTRIDSLADIRSIGTDLAAALERGRFSYYNKYIMIHEFNPEEEVLFSGDVMILKETAGVDHIDNLRLIIAAYLEEAYDYSADDARVLAVFITYYNAVYRGDMAYFSGKYIPGVLSHLSAAKVGIALRYQEWPGKSQLVIPLTPPGRAGSVSALDTDVLTEESVIESLRDEEGMSLDVRKEMTEIKEEEIREEESAIEETRRELEDREEEIDRTREEIAGREQALEEKEQDDPEAERERQEIEEEKQELAEAEEGLKESVEELEEREERQEERLEQIREEREQIAEDEKTVMDEGSGAVREMVEKEDYTEAPFLLLSTDPEAPGTMALIRVDSGKTETSSSMTSIHGGRFYDFAGGYLVIAGEESGNRIISLMLLEKETLEVSVSASVSVSPYSKIFIDGDTAYAAVRHEGKWVPGRFDFELNLTGLIDDEMIPHSSLVVEEGYLVYQDERARVKSGNLEDMIVPE